MMPRAVGGPAAAARRFDRAAIGAGLGCFAGVPFWEAVARVRALGFDSIELLSVEGSRHSIGALPGIWFDGISDADLERLRSALAPFARTSVHAPFVDAPLFTYNRGIAREALRQVKACIAVAGRLGMTAVAVHANGRAGLGVDEYWDDMVGVFRELGDAAAEAGTAVALETGFPRRYDQFLGLVRDIDHPAVGACVDIGHVAFLEESGPPGTDEGVRNYNDRLDDLCRALGDHLIHMHIHDVRQADWRDHRQLGSGVVDLPRLAGTLLDIGYAGLLQLELEEPEREAALLASRSALERAIGGASAGGDALSGR